MANNGDYWGVGLAQLWSVSIILLGDRLLLSTLKAKKMGASHHLVQRIDNLRALRRFERRFEVFVTKELSDNILIIDSGFKSPALVVGQGVLTSVEDEDLSHLLKAALEKLEFDHWRFASLSAQLVSIFALPVILFSLLEKTRVLCPLVSAPASAVTKLLWRLGGVKLSTGNKLDSLIEKYPALWRAPKPRLNQPLRAFIEYLLGFYVLVRPVAESLPPAIGAAQVSRKMERA
tara:strand:- start:394 stop:1092 length:699 start_codon:yes stop_codon:yes gene_type:complete